jgi:N-acetylglucosamine kinase-like BadF-type ATPase
MRIAQQCTCCPPGNAAYFLAARVRYSYHMRCVLGFDGGGTKTDCVLMDETGAILARTRSGASNPVLVGVDAATAALIEAAEKACAASGTSFEDIKILSGGVAGAGATRDSSQLIALLQGRFANARISILSDLSMALAATAETPSVVVIAGTGSAVFGRNAAGETSREGGLGVILGDPGSAYDIARRAIVEEWRRVRNGTESPLRSEILGHFRCSWVELQEQIRTNPNKVLPEIFPFVVRAANADDQVAQQLLSAGAEELAELGQRVIAKLNLCGEAFFFAKTGGVFGRSACFDGAFDRQIRVVAPKARLGPLPAPVAEFAARSAAAALQRYLGQRAS